MYSKSIRIHSVRASGQPCCPLTNEPRDARRREKEPSDAFGAAHFIDVAWKARTIPALILLFGFVLIPIRWLEKS